MSPELDVALADRPGRAVLDVAHGGPSRLLDASFAPIAFGPSTTDGDAAGLAGLLARSGRSG